MARSDDFSCYRTHFLASFTPHSSHTHVYLNWTLSSPSTRWYTFEIVKEKIGYFSSRSTILFLVEIRALHPIPYDSRALVRLIIRHGCVSSHWLHGAGCLQLHCVRTLYIFDNHNHNNNEYACTDRRTDGEQNTRYKFVFLIFLFMRFVSHYWQDCRFAAPQIIN